MGKHCLYGGCETGRNADRDKRKRLGLRQLSVFRVPRNMLQRWSKAIGCCLLLSDFVCELHFSKDLINKEYHIRMSDGTLKVIPRIQLYPFAGAVCITDDNQENVDDSKENGPTNGIPGPSGKRAFVCDDRVTKLPTTSQHGTPKEVTTHNSEVLDLEDQPTAFADQLLESSSETWSTYSESVDGVRDFSVGVASDMDVSSPDSVASNDHEGEEDGPARFTIDDVFAHLKGTHFPESWSRIRNPRGRFSVMYVHIDRRTLRIRLHLVCDNSLMYTICLVF